MDGNAIAKTQSTELKPVELTVVKNTAPTPVNFVTVGKVTVSTLFRYRPCKFKLLGVTPKTELKSINCHLLESREDKGFFNYLNVNKYLDELNEIDVKSASIFRSFATTYLSKIEMRPEKKLEISQIKEQRDTILADMVDDWQHLSSGNTHSYPKMYSYLSQVESFYTDFFRAVCESGRCKLRNNNPASVLESKFIERQMKDYYYACDNLSTDNERLIEMYIYAFMQYIHRNDYKVTELEGEISRTPKAGQTNPMKEKTTVRASNSFDYYLNQVRTETKRHFALKNR